MTKHCKAQVSAFIIIGIILLLAIGAFLLINYTVLKEPTITPQEFLPIKLYVEECAVQQAEVAATLTGQQGGYLYVPDEIRLDPTAYIQQLEGSPFILPYWYYPKDQEDRIPTIEEMEANIERYIEENIDGCLGSFQPFKDKFSIERTAGPTADATIAEDKISVALDYPLEIIDLDQDRTIEMQDFIADLNISLGKAHSVAKDIMMYENEEAFLENLTIDMIQTNPDFPTEGMEFSCTAKYSKAKLESDMKQMLKYNLNYVQFSNTDTIDTGIPYYESFYKVLPSSRKYDDTLVRTRYAPEYGMKFDVYPSTGDLVQGNSLDIPIVGNCIKVYHQFYSLEYPVVFTITEYTDPENPYLFSFATPVIVTNNAANRFPDITIVNQSLIGITTEDYCFGADNEISVIAEDKLTRDELSGVDISYECINFDCYIGQTAQPTFDGIPIARSSPKLNGIFPDCINGYIVANKEGYLEYAEQITPEEESLKVIELTPLKKLNYTFVVRTQAGARKLKDNETVFLQLYNDDIEYRDVLYYPSNSTEYSNLELIIEDTGYNLTIIMVQGDRPIGGMEMEWNVTAEQLENSDNVMFTLISTEPVPKDLDEYAELYVEKIIPASTQNMPILT